MERAVMPSSIKILGIDADDTLWQNEEFFRLAQDQFVGMLVSYILPDRLNRHLLATERCSLSLYRYQIRALCCL